MSRLLIVVAVGLIAASHPIAAHARQKLDPWAQEMIEWLVQTDIFRSYMAQGFEINDAADYFRQMPSGTRRQRVQINLKTGFRYVFIATCDSACPDLDLALYDVSGRKVREDTQPDKTPVIEYIPSVPGTYTLEGVIDKCNGIFYCNWGGGVLAHD
jgi:hypothetical protein